MSAFTVPAIDISAYIGEGSDEERREIARQIDEAARTVGFMQITGHGIPLETWQRLGRAIDRFFALPLEEKKRYRAPKGINRGYSPPKSERLSYSLGVEKAERMNDFFEAFNTGATQADYPHVELDPIDYAANIWPEVEEFQSDVENWMTHAGSVAHVMIRIFEDALHLPTGTLTGMSRDVAADRIRALGGTFQSSVGKDTTYLVVGGKVGASKLKKAQSYGTQIIDEAQLIKLLEA